MIARRTGYAELAHLLHRGGADSSSGRSAPLPSRRAVVQLLESGREILFPDRSNDGHCTHARLEADLAEFRALLSQQVYRALAARCESECERSALESQADEFAHDLVSDLPALQRSVHSDVEGAYKGDPALHSAEEVILCYPGIAAMIAYRIAHALNVLGVPILPRMMTAHAHSETGIDIHPGAQIGRSFFIDHGTGVVIGGTAIIGDRVRIYHGVTLGAKNLSSGPDGFVRKGRPRHPIIEDDVVIYSCATILGRITIGRGSVIGGNVWVTRDVPPGSVITQAKVRHSEFANGAGI